MLTYGDCVDGVGVTIVVAVVIVLPAVAAGHHENAAEAPAPRYDTVLQGGLRTRDQHRSAHGGRRVLSIPSPLSAPQTSQRVCYKGSNAANPQLTRILSGFCIKDEKKGKGGFQASAAQRVCAAEERQQAQPSPPPQGLLWSFSAALGLSCQQTRPTRGRSPSARPQPHTRCALPLPENTTTPACSGSTFPDDTLHRGHSHLEKQYINEQAREQLSWKHRGSMSCVGSAWQSFAWFHVPEPVTAASARRKRIH